MSAGEDGPSFLCSSIYILERTEETAAGVFVLLAEFVATAIVKLLVGCFLANFRVVSYPFIAVFDVDLVAGVFDSIILFREALISAGLRIVSVLLNIDIRFEFGEPYYVIFLLSVLFLVNFMFIIFDVRALSVAGVI